MQPVSKPVNSLTHQAGPKTVSRVCCQIPSEDLATTQKERNRFTPTTFQRQPPPPPPALVLPTGACGSALRPLRQELKLYFVNLTVPPLMILMPPPGNYSKTPPYMFWNHFNCVVEHREAP